MINKQNKHEILYTQKNNKHKESNKDVKILEDPMLFYDSLFFS